MTAPRKAESVKRDVETVHPPVWQMKVLIALAVANFLGLLGLGVLALGTEDDLSTLRERQALEDSVAVAARTEQVAAIKLTAKVAEVLLVSDSARNGYYARALVYDSINAARDSTTSAKILNALSGAGKK